MAERYLPISDYGLIGDVHSAALVSRDGSVDWACFPRFDSGSIFGRILDSEKGGYFQVRPRGDFTSNRRYLPGTNIIETTFESNGNRAILTDFMSVEPESRPEKPGEVYPGRQIVRLLRCDRGSMEFEAVCEPRFDYGSVVPHVTLLDEREGRARGGPDSIFFHASAPIRQDRERFSVDLLLQAGDHAYLAVTYARSDVDRMSTGDAELQSRFTETRDFWERWSNRFRYAGLYADEARRSALTLKALTYAPTGAIVAAPTSSLPEAIGGPRNWDYRYTWVRDATFVLYALSLVGFRDEALAFNEWIERTTEGRARDLQLMYGVGGERRLTEIELDHLDGYRGSRPVRIGNGAHRQFQLDIYGWVLDSAHTYRKHVGGLPRDYWEFLRRVAQFVTRHWREPDNGIWEVRSEPKHFVSSKVLCWVAMDRAIRAVEDLGLEGDVDGWRATREEIRREVLDRGYDAEVGAFVQHFDSKQLDASNLLLPMVGFIDPDDPRMRATVDKTIANLTSHNGLVYRYLDADDGVGGPEGAFTICTFWLLNNLTFQGRLDEARRLLEQLRGYANDLELFSEQIDVKSGAMLGNFPQAFSHVAFINSVVNLHRAGVREESPEPAGAKRPEPETPQR